MATEYTQEIAVGFGKQSAAGTYNSTLDAISSTWLASTGLLLGSSGSGVADSGLSLSIGRVGEDVSPASGSFTRDLSRFLRASVPTFTFVCPFAGSRVDTTATPVDADFNLETDLPGLDALLGGMGMSGAASGTPGHVYNFGYNIPISALVYYHGNRLELLDCRVSGVIDCPPGATPQLTATVEVGSIKDASAASIPGTLTYGTQQSVTPPVTGTPAAGFTWGTARGFSAFSLSISPTISETPDSEATGGIRKAVDDRSVTASALMWKDSAGSGEVFEYGQVVETDSGNLSSLSWQCGAAATGSDPAKAFIVTMPTPEATEEGVAVLDGNAASEMSLIARAGTADTELTIEFV